MPAGSTACVPWLTTSTAGVSERLVTWDEVTSSGRGHLYRWRPQGPLEHPSYLGKIRLDGELVDGAHPALVDQETFDRCQAIRTRKSKRMKRTFTRYHYPLAPVLVCGQCGGKMYGEAQGSGGTGPIRLYYGCSNRRKRLARIPNDKCEAPWIRAAELETALREELARCLPDANVNAALRDGLGG